MLKFIVRHYFMAVMCRESVVEIPKDENLDENVQWICEDAIEFMQDYPERVKLRSFGKAMTTQEQDLVPDWGDEHVDVEELGVLDQIVEAVDESMSSA